MRFDRLSTKEHLNKRSMDSAINQQNNIRSHKVGKRAATVGGIALIIALLIPIFFYQDPPPGQPGILVNLGTPDQGQGDENAQASAAQPAQAEPEPPTPSEPEVVPPTPEPEVEPEPSRSEPQPEPEVIKTEDPSAVALRQAKEREARAKADADRKAREAREAADRKAQAEADRKAREAREAAEAKAKADAERKAREDAANATKDQIGGLFGSGSGKGNSGTSGNQGDPNGDPNASAVDGISTGKGNVTGLGGRGIVNAPPVTGRTQDAGRVVVRICVDSSGKVVSAKYQIGNSRSATVDLIRIAEANAKSYKFSSSTLDSQCGEITYNFSVQ